MNENNGRYDSENRYVQQNDTDRNATGFYTALYGSQEPSVPVPPAQNDWLDIEKELPKSNDAKKIIPAAIAAVAVIVLIVAVFAAQTRKKPSGGGTPAVSPRTPVTDVPAREDQPVPVTAHIYFDANGGMADYTERTGCIGDAYGQLPDAAKDGCEFVGWFTEREGGESVTPYTEIKAANETVYAHWVEKKPAATSETTTAQPRTEPTAAPKTERPTTQRRTEPATASAVERSNQVLLQNTDMIVYAPAGFAIVGESVLPLEEAVSARSGATGIIGNDSYYTNLECRTYVGDGGHSASWFAENDAADIGTSSYTRTVNGLRFSCVDYKNEYGWYGTILYYISDGKLIEIIGTSGARSSIWPMLEACVFGV